MNLASIVKVAVGEATVHAPSAAILRACAHLFGRERTRWLLVTHPFFALKLKLRPLVFLSLPLTLLNNKTKMLK